MAQSRILLPLTEHDREKMDELLKRGYFVERWSVDGKQQLVVRKHPDVVSSILRRLNARDSAERDRK